MNLKRIILSLISIRIIILVISYFLPLTGPHEWRQFDTIGMTQRYFIEIFQNSTSLYPSLLPAVLQAGDSLGITPAELPLLNFILSPFFTLGEYLGQAFIQITLLIFNIQLLYLNFKYWSNEDVFGKKIGNSFLLIPIFSFSHAFFGKFMPDVLSVNLALFALAFAIKNKKYTFPFFIGSIALLIKPTSVIVFALLLGSKSIKKWQNWVWILASVIITIAYYKVVNPYILTFSDRPSFFAVGTKALMHSIEQIISKKFHFIDIFLKNIMGNYLILGYSLALIYASLKKQIALNWHFKIWGLITLQCLFLHLLSGDHPFWHNYYYLGCAPLISLLYYDLLENIKTTKVKVILLLLLSTPIVLKSIYDLKPLINPEKKLSWGFQSQCDKLKSETRNFPWDQAYHFRSPAEMFPVLGTCFGEIQNAASTEYGFFYHKNSLPFGCAKVAQSNDLYLVKCSLK